MSEWNTAKSDDFRGPLDVTRAATVVLDAQDRVIGWSAEAEALLGYPSDEVVGRPVAALLSPWPAAGPQEAEEPAEVPAGSPFGRSEIRLALHRDGHRLRIATALCPLTGGGPAQCVLAAAELGDARLWESRLSMLHGLATQSPVGLGIYDTDLRLTWCNFAYEQQVGQPFEEFHGMRADELYSEGRFVTPGYPDTLDTVMHHVLDTGEPILDLHFRGEPPSDPGTDHLWSCSYYRLQGADGEVIGVCEDAFDISDRYEAQRRLALLVEAGRGVGAALDAVATAEELTSVAVPDFADAVTVDLAAAVLDGDVPGPGNAAEMALVRIATRSVTTRREGGSPAREEQLRSPPFPVDHPPDTPQDRALASGGLVLHENTLVVPLRAGGSTLGLLTFVRAVDSATFDSGEVALADELAARTAVSIDNARRFTRERSAALALQRQLLPQHLPRQSAVDVAHRYLPTDDVSGVGGDWFDVIPLSGTRVGLVVGDVVGHGLQAAATMGRLRTTVRALAQLDLRPDELLKRLDDLVGQTADEMREVPDAQAGGDDLATGATCLYAVYDPVSRRCVMARAGHLPPAIVDSGGEVSFPALPAGPPLGLGGLPFECSEIELPVGSLLALFTDGLVEARGRDVDEGLGTLVRVLGDREKPLEDLCDRIVAELLPEGTAADDTALLLVRTRELAAGSVAEWELPAEPLSVGRARDLANEQLHTWNMDEMSFTTELVVSELVTNAVTHADGPLSLRLIRDRTLLCEVADAGHTSPHLRHSAEDDEGGRGLFIVAQLVQRWGTRYTPSGKTIWTEQALPAAP
ncbi:SpoIIE family protein phosphatase [Streptomyces sp. NBC_00344]|uniref:SpoIIE family protein phosphatase n=1 Tax=Streptomyces sp. NBC_00344 TaxID=2975720 RepID=UPI002E217825